MPHQYWRSHLERVQDGEVILGEALFAVAIIRVTGRPETASRDAVHMVGTGEPVGEAIKDVSGVTESGQQYDGPPYATPVENLESHAIFDSYELHFVIRRIMPSRAMFPAPGDHQAHPHKRG